MIIKERRREEEKKCKINIRHKKCFLTLPGWNGKIELNYTDAFVATL